MNKHKLISLFLGFLIVFSPLVMAQEDIKSISEIVSEPQTSDYLTKEDFSVIETPTLDDYSRLSPHDQANYLAENYLEFNPGFAQEFSNYLTETYGTNYQISAIASDFLFDPEAGILTNNGVTISFGDYQDDDTIDSIEVTAEGINIVRRGQQVSFTGEIIVQSNEAGFLFEDKEGNTLDFQIKGEEDVSFDFQEDGSLEIRGSVSGRTMIANKPVVFDNHEGLLVFFSNGDILAENAEVLTHEIYADGNFEKRGNDIVARDVAGGQTIVVDRRTRVGVKTQGQTGENKVTIHLNQRAESSQFFSRELPADAGDQLEQIRQEVSSLSSLRPVQGDKGDDAEVWIHQEGETQRITITAKGKADVGFYSLGASGGAVLSERDPHFIGEDGQSELDMQIGQTSTLNLRGKSTYSDDQYSKLRMNQAGSVLRISRAGYTDQILAECFACQSGESAFTLQKRVVLVDRLKQGTLFGTIEDLVLDVQVTEGGLTFDPLSQLGKIAGALGEEGRASIGRNLMIKTRCAEGRECNFQLSHDQQTGELKGFFERYDPEKEEISRIVALDLNLKKFTGEPLVLLNSEEYYLAQRFLQSYQERGLEGVIQFDFPENEQLRKLLLAETGLDITLLSDQTYVQKVRRAQELRQKAAGYLQQLSGRGTDISHPEQLGALLKSRGPNFYLYTAAMMDLQQAQLEEARALRQAGEISESKLNELEQKVDRSIFQMRVLRRAADEEVLRQTFLQDPQVASLLSTQEQMVSEGEQQISQWKKEKDDLEAQLNSLVLPVPPEQIREEISGLNRKIEEKRQEVVRARQQVTQIKAGIEREIIQQLGEPPREEELIQVTMQVDVEGMRGGERTAEHQQAREEVLRLVEEKRELVQSLQYAEDSLRWTEEMMRGARESGITGVALSGLQRDIDHWREQVRLGKLGVDSVDYQLIGEIGGVGIERPDLAARLAAEVGEMGITLTGVPAAEAKPLSYFDLALELEARVVEADPAFGAEFGQEFDSQFRLGRVNDLLRQGDLVGAVQEYQEIAQAGGTATEVDTALAENMIKEFVLRQTGEYSAELRNKIWQKETSHRYWGVSPTEGEGVFSEQALDRLGGMANFIFDAISLTPAVSLYEQRFEETKGQLEKAEGDSSEISRKLNQLVYDEGMSIFAAIEIVQREFDESAGLSNLFTQTSGRELTAEEEAAALYEEIMEQRAVCNGKTAHVLTELEDLRARYPGTEAASRAAMEIEPYVDTGFRGDIRRFVEENDLDTELIAAISVLDVPIAQAVKLLSDAKAGRAVLEAALRGTEVANVAEGATRASHALHHIDDLGSAARPLLSGEREVSSTVRGRLFESGTPEAVRLFENLDKLEQGGAVLRIEGLQFVFDNVPSDLRAVADDSLEGLTRIALPLDDITREATSPLTLARNVQEEAALQRLGGGGDIKVNPQTAEEFPRWRTDPEVGIAARSEGVSLDAPASLQEGTTGIPARSARVEPAIALEAPSSLEHTILSRMDTAELVETKVAVFENPQGEGYFFGMGDDIYLVEREPGGIRVSGVRTEFIPEKGGDFRLLSDDTHHLAIEEDPDVMAQITKIFEKAESGVGTQRLTPRQRAAVRLRERIGEESISVHAASSEFDSIFINPHGTHQRYLGKVEEAIDSNPILKQLHQRIREGATKGEIPPLRFSTEELEEVPRWAFASHTDNQEKVVRYRLFESKSELIDSARRHGYTGNRFEEAKEFVSHELVRSVTGHETFHYTYRNLISNEDRQRLIAFLNERRWTDHDIAGAFNYIEESRNYRGSPREIQVEEFLTHRLGYYAYGSSGKPGFDYLPSDEELNLLKESGFLPDNYVAPGRVAEIPPPQSFGYTSRRQILDDVDPFTSFLDQQNIKWAVSGSGSIADELAAIGQKTGDADLLIPTRQVDRINLELKVRVEAGTLDEIGIAEYRPLQYNPELGYQSEATGFIVLENGQKIDLISGFGYKVTDPDIIRAGYLEVSLGIRVPVELAPDGRNYRVILFELDETGNPTIPQFFKTGEGGARFMTTEALKVKYTFEGRFDRLELLGETLPPTERYTPVKHVFVDYSPEYIAKQGSAAYGQDWVVEDITGRRFFITEKGIKENQLAERVGTLLQERMGATVRERLHFPEMRTADFGQGQVLLMEYVEGGRELEHAGEISREVGTFATAENIWVRNWDFKGEHILVTPDGRATLIDLERGFWTEADVPLLREGGPSGRILSGRELNKGMLRVIAERQNPFYEVTTIDDYQETIRAIQSLTDSDYAQIERLAIEVGFTESEAKAIALRLKESARTLESDISLVLDGALDHRRRTAYTDALFASGLNSAERNRLLEAGSRMSTEEFVVVMERVLPPETADDLARKFPVAEEGIVNDDLVDIVNSPALASDFPIKLGPGAQRFGEKHIVEIKRLVEEGKLGSAQRYLEGNKHLLNSEDVIKLENFIEQRVAAQIVITSSIDADSGLVRLAKRATRNEDVRKDLDHLILELSKGNLQAGIGLGHISGTDVSYMRGRNGGRLFFRKTREGYEIVGKSGKADEQKVIDKMIEFYAIS